jgi:hypothetical protein
MGASLNDNYCTENAGTKINQLTNIKRCMILSFLTRWSGALVVEMFVGSSATSMESKLNFQLHGITLQYDSRKQQCNDKPTTSKWSNFLHRLMNTTLHYIITHWKLLLPSPGEQIVSLTCNQHIHSKWVTTSQIIMEIKKSHKINGNIQT